MLAFAMMASIRHKANATISTPKKTLPPRRLSAGRSRKFGA
jgi:hypothetical protein